MTRTSDDTQYSNMANYLGALWLAGKKRMPFMAAIGGGLDEKGFPTNLRRAKDWKFPLTNTYTIDAPSQPAITEDASMIAAAGTTYTGAEVHNVCQIFQERITVSYAKQSSQNELGSLAVQGEIQAEMDPLIVQQTMHFKQMAANMDYTMLNGTFIEMIGADTASKTKGIFEAIVTNDQAGGAGQLTTAMVEGIGKTMYDNGADFDNIAIFVNSYQRKKITDLYGVVPEDRSIGGASITRVITDFFDAPVILDQNVPIDAILIADLAHLHPFVLLVPDKKGGGFKPPVFWEELAQAGAGVIGHIYSQMGLDYGQQLQHGKITSLASS